MIGGILLLVLLFVVTIPLLRLVKAKYKFVDQALLQNLFWFHYLLSIAYYITAVTSGSDSKGYFHRSSDYYSNWLDIYATGTRFIDFIAYPLTHGVGFSYEMMMVLFSWIGYWGFVFFYIYFRENLRFRHKWQGIDLLTLIMFLPNMHFWTSSLGKGSVIFFGLGLTIFAVSKIGSRKIPLILGLLVVYQVRPHVFLFLIVGIMMGLFFGRSKVPLYQKLLVVAGASAALALSYNQILQFSKLDSDNVVESFDAFTTSRALELAKSDSGVDISNYPLPLKLFTFWFRPLFIDSPNFMGIIPSVENLFYLVLTAKIFTTRFLKFIFKGSTLVKTSAVIFLAASIALSFALSNLGIIIRQKSMVMYFYFFLILSFLDYEKGLLLLKKKKRMELRMARAKKKAAVQTAGA